MVSFSRCLLAVTAILLAISSATAQGTAGTLGGACVNGVTCNTGLSCLLGICTIGLPAGSEGGACLAGNTCNTGLTCFLGFCATVSSGGSTSGATAGSMGGACLAGNTCNTGLTCFAGICTMGTSLPAGSEGGSCLTGNTCNTGLSCLFGFCVAGAASAGAEGGACLAGNTCNAGLSCFFGICAAGTTGLPTAGAFGGACLAGNTCNTGLSCLAGICTLAPAAATCKTDADCPFQKCDTTTNTCTAWVVPDLNCNGNCPANTQCRLGVCLPVIASTCPNTCNTGESCVYGSCVQSAPTCSNSCTGNCVATVNGPQCVPAGTSCMKTSDCNTGSSINQICTFGTCTNVPAAFQNLISNSTVFGATVRDNILAELANIGASLSSFTSVQASANVNAQIAGGSFNANAGALIQLDNSVTTLQTLAFNGANAAARIEAGTSQVLQNLNAAAAQAQLLVGVGAKAAAASVNVAVGASLSVSMGAATAAAGATNSIAQFAALTLAGPLSVVGDINSIFTFPSNSSAVKVSNGATVKVSGGVCLTGNAGMAPISIVANGNVAASAQVSPKQFFETAANILGDAASFTIGGVAAFSGNVVQPALNLTSGAVVSFAARVGSASATIAGDISFDASSAANNAQLVVNGTAAAGANLFFKVIHNCPRNAMITYNVEGSASVALANGFVMFNYAASTYVNVGNFTCGIQVCGSTDLACTPINNPYRTATGRRLLATGNQASFGPTSASVASGSTATVQAASQIKVASTVFAVLFALVVALMYKL